RSSYSSAGSSLWVSGLGGEYGRQVAYSPGYAAVSYKPAIVTTDLAGCVRGSNANGNVRNALSTDASTIDNTCNYVGTMNGTSAAAPTVSGVAALMLQANPKLSFRDVRY
ncbi:S8 family serine peptidase, partial [Streptomyces sp. S9]|nr:S8 family serine peptidase [Streptomyces sp. S9]